MSNWLNTTLGEMIATGKGKIQTGPFGSQLHASDYVDVGIPCIMPANMSNNRVNLNGVAKITKEDANRLSQHLVRHGDIVYSRRGDVTQKALIRENEVGYFCGTGCLLIRPGEKLDSEFLTYYLSTPKTRNWIISQAVGATMPNLNTSILSNIPLRIPTKPVQQKIALSLSVIDNKIELNNRINAELEAMAKTLYDYWFVQFDFPDANGKPYKTAGGKMVYNPTLKREIPKDWTNIKLNQLLTNKPQSINVSQISKEEPYTPIDYLPSRKMSFGEYAPSSEASTSLIKYNKGDILIGAMRVYFHRVCVAPFNGITRQTTMVLKPNNLSFLPFLYQVCNEDRAINFANIISVGTQQPYVNWDNGFENYEIPYPNNINIIEKYSSSMESTVNSVVQRNLENNRLTELRDWLLPMLMNGQVTVNS